jgi:hypothetical protein
VKSTASLLCVALALAACADVTNTAIFVTSSSVGINADGKPPTIAVAYERVEGFIGPRSNNGGAPPVVASMETDGSVFSPQIRQTYATGPASVIAVTAGTGSAANDTVDADEKKGGPKDLEGPRKPMFFGTGTTLGFKVGFGAEGTPDSLVLGYKRKEISVIPLGVTRDEKTGKEKAHYPSVLASIDTTSRMTDVPTAGLATKQFFATGRAADILANNPNITKAFKVKSAASLLDSLTTEQMAKAEAVAVVVETEKTKQFDIIVAAISCDGKKTLDPTLRDKLAVDAGLAPNTFASAKTPEDLKKLLAGAPTLVERLSKIASTEGRPTCLQR